MQTGFNDSLARPVPLRGVVPVCGILPPGLISCHAGIRQPPTLSNVTIA